jgi:carboxypeptidase Taq
MQEIADLQSASSMLQWDQETYMPIGASEFRGRQIATLSGLAHEKFTNGEIADLVAKLLDGDLNDVFYKRSLLRIQKDLIRKQKFSRDFVEKQAIAISRAYEKWELARSNDSFSLFANQLKTLIELKKEECELIGYREHPYDALVEEFEPGMRKIKLDQIFSKLLPQLNGLLDQIKQTNYQPNNQFLLGKFDTTAQWNLGVKIINLIGYDFKRGRQDLSTHPFTISMSPDDVRVTTRISENNFQEMLWSCLHEAGHGIYEQGLLHKEYGFPGSEAASLGIHESQSRLWENQVGRELPFWKGQYAQLTEAFPTQFSSVAVEDFYKGINIVEPSLIRTNADELTYHFHVFIRYTLECLLLEDKLLVNDLPEAWNELYKKHLGISPKSTIEGVLQDVHWAHGSFGYFPTYSLGSLYAAQFYAAAKLANPGLEQELEQGKTAQLLQWLSKNIFEKGRLFDSEEICEMATGTGLNPDIFIEYLNKKYQTVYNLQR